MRGRPPSGLRLHLGHPFDPKYLNGQIAVTAYRRSNLALDSAHVAARLRIDRLAKLSFARRTPFGRRRIADNFLDSASSLLLLVPLFLPASVALGISRRGSIEAPSVRCDNESAVESLFRIGVVSP